MLRLTEAQENLDIVEGEVTDFLMDGQAVVSVILADGSEIPSKSVILTSGTFLRGVIHIGDVSKPGGRMGDKPSVKLAERLDSFELPLGLPRPAHHRGWMGGLSTGTFWMLSQATMTRSSSPS